jgi:hypothetical protein
VSRRSDAFWESVERIAAEQRKIPDYLRRMSGVHHSEFSPPPRPWNWASTKPGLRSHDNSVIKVDFCHVFGTGWNPADWKTYIHSTRLSECHCGVSFCAIESQRRHAINAARGGR